MEHVDVTSEQHLYLQFILGYFRKYTQWPTHRQMDHFFNQQHADLDIEDIWKSLPSGLTSYLEINILDNKATLTLPGIYALELNAPEFEIFLKIIRLCVTSFLTSENHEIGSEGILRNHPTWFEPSVYLAGWLLYGEPNIWQSFTGPHPQSGHWSCTIARGIR